MYLTAAKDDGYDVIVTETDKIKAVLAKAGVDISIYGDDLSMEQLTDITGSQTEAAMLVNQMKAYDIPATDDNIKAGTDAIDRAKSLVYIGNRRIHVISDQICLCLIGYICKALCPVYGKGWCRYIHIWR